MVSSVTDVYTGYGRGDGVSSQDCSWVFLSSSKQLAINNVMPQGCFGDGHRCAVADGFKRIMMV